MAKNGLTAAKAQSELNRALPVFGNTKFGDFIVGLLNILNALVGSASAVVSSKAGLVIHGAASALAKAGSPVLANFNGAYVRKAANTDMAALNGGNLATAKSAAWAFYIAADGTLSTSAKTADAATHDAALALVPAVPAGKAQIGLVVVDNASGANFVAGTTALDAAGLTVTFYDTPGPQPVAAAVASRDLVSF